MYLNWMWRTMNSSSSDTSEKVRFGIKLVEER